MKVIFIILLLMMPLEVFAESKNGQRYTVSNIKVKEVNSIGKSQDVDKSVLIDVQSGQVWLFVGGKDDKTVSLVSVKKEYESKDRVAK